MELRTFGAILTFAAEWEGEAAGWYGLHTEGAQAERLAELAAAARRREARFVCTAVLLAPDRRRSWVFTGTCEGTIAREPRGDGGFGYDPVFCPRGEERTFGEMSPEEKERFSHRGAAAKKMVQALPSVVESLLG